MTRLLMLCLVLCSGTAAAQDWPARPVRFILSQPPGTSPDITARFLGDRVPHGDARDAELRRELAAGEHTGGGFAPQAQELGFGFIVVAVDFEQRFQAANRVGGAALLLGQVRQRLERDHVLGIQLGDTEEIQLREGPLPRVEVAAAPNDVGRDITRVVSQPGIEQLGGDPLVRLHAR